MVETTPKVFIDANVIISAGKPPGGPEIDRVVDLVEAGLVTVLTIDLTITEVAKKHSQNDFDAIKEIIRPHIRRIVEEATGVVLPDLERPQLRQKLSEIYKKSTAEMFTALNATILAIDEVKPSVVFDAYAAGNGFFSGDGKKDQFPDAFAFECLKKEASQNTPVIIVSNDGDFEHPVRSANYISLVKSLPDLFAALGLEMEAPEIEVFLKTHNGELIEWIDHVLNDWGVYAVDVEDAEIHEITVNSIEFQKLTAFKPTEDGGSILVVAKVYVEALVSYTHPNWETAIYDSEDKVLIPFEDVDGESDVDLVVDISMSLSVKDDGDPDKIEELTVRNSDFLYVTLYPMQTYE